jgi:molybdopterin/thiamine biosynthesis adenylyltransferase
MILVLESNSLLYRSLFSQNISNGGDKYAEIRSSIAVKGYDNNSLWQAHGQASLEKSSICLLGSNNLGTETLKNLILPGIGSFTIVDDKIVDGSDVGSNFFLLPSNLGNSRAEAASVLLSELNGQVKGNFVNQVDYF